MVIDMLLYQTLAFTIHGKYKKFIQKFKTSTPIWNEDVELPDGSYSVSNIQDSFEYILKNMCQLL